MLLAESQRHICGSELWTICLPFIAFAQKVQRVGYRTKNTAGNKKGKLKKKHMANWGVGYCPCVFGGWAYIINRKIHKLFRSLKHFVFERGREREYVCKGKFWLDYLYVWVLRVCLHFHLCVCVGQVVVIWEEILMWNCSRARMSCIRNTNVWATFQVYEKQQYELQSNTN